MPDERRHASVAKVVGTSVAAFGAAAGVGIAMGHASAASSSNNSQSLPSNRCVQAFATIGDGLNAITTAVRYSDGTCYTQEPVQQNWVLAAGSVQYANGSGVYYCKQVGWFGNAAGTAYSYNPYTWTSCGSPKSYRATTVASTYIPYSDAWFQVGTITGWKAY